MLEVENSWKAETAFAASVGFMFQTYWKTVAELGAGKVLTVIAVVIPNEGPAPLMA